MKKISWFLPVLLCVYTFAYSLTHLASINQITQSTLEAIFQLIPSLFFLMFLFGMMNQIGIFEIIGFFLEKILNPILHLGTRASGLYVASIFAGYPTFAILIGEAYRKQEINQNEFMHLMRICSHASPAFIMLTVGVTMCGSLGNGLILWIIHILSNLFLAIFLRPKTHGEKIAWSCVCKCKNHIPLIVLCQRLFVQCTKTFVYIFGFMLIFNVLYVSLFSHLDGALFFHGILEFSAGTLALINQPVSQIFTFASFFLGFSGISCMMQVQAVLSDLTWPKRSYIVARFLQGTIALLLSIFYLWITC